ncbi:hypothetical protein L226DRAFT_574795 [Lentinus tigrinus ALCF2SS1-7]|uniref:uncharacterized protein n=1 Tax=Lentinus tigrinus ALCF2SS1-7 TaxID=1328758 RepID=UPI001165D6A0|nr:hypothetical protein L226DRAFT_574795 [Lentinus tigrinus ALCF2SS1-7]
MALNVEQHPLPACPHPMTCLRRVHRLLECNVPGCTKDASFVCASCKDDVPYCGPCHAAEDWARHECARDVGIGQGEATAYCRIVQQRRALVRRSSDISLALDATAGSPFRFVIPPPSVAVDVPARKVRGFYLEVNEGEYTRMRVVDVPLQALYCDAASGRTRWAAVIIDYVMDPVGRSIVMFGNNMEPRQYPLVIFYDMNIFSEDEDIVCELEPNQTVLQLVEHVDPPPAVWCGPVLVLKARNEQLTDFVAVDGYDLEDVQGFFARVG